MGQRTERKKQNKRGPESARNATHHRNECHSCTWGMCIKYERTIIVAKNGETRYKIRRMTTTTKKH